MTTEAGGDEALAVTSNHSASAKHTKATRTNSKSSSLSDRHHHKSGSSNKRKGGRTGERSSTNSKSSGSGNKKKTSSSGTSSGTSRRNKPTDEATVNGTGGSLAPGTRLKKATSLRDFNTTTTSSIDSHQNKNAVFMSTNSKKPSSSRSPRRNSTFQGTSTTSSALVGANLGTGQPQQSLSVSEHGANPRPGGLRKATSMSDFQKSIGLAGAAATTAQGWSKTVGSSAAAAAASADSAGGTAPPPPKDPKKAHRRRTNSVEALDRRKTLQGEHGQQQRRSSRRSLLMDSSSTRNTTNSKQTSRRRLVAPTSGGADASQDRGGGGGSSAGGASLDASRVSTGSMEASGKEREGGRTSSAGSSRKGSTLQEHQRPPSNRRSSSRRLLPPTGGGSNKSSLEPSRGTAANPDVLSPEGAADAGGKSRNSKPESLDKITNNHQKETSVTNTGEKDQQPSTHEKTEKESSADKLDAMGFPSGVPSPSKGGVGVDGSQAGDNDDADFGHLPDFQVGDFSFKDLKFCMFDDTAIAAANNKQDATTATTNVKLDNAKAAELSSKEEAKNKKQQQRREEEDMEEKKDAGAGSANPHSSGKSSKPPPPTSRDWTCEGCGEEHNESELQFCGMCGAERPKITPKHKKSIRSKSSSGGGGRHNDNTKSNSNNKRESTSGRKPMRRSRTMDSHQQQHQQHHDESGSRSAASRKSSAPSLERPSSAGAPRRLRTRDKSGSVPATPRSSRSKGKIRPRSSNAGSSKDKEEEDVDLALVVKCLDGDNNNAAESIDLDMLNQQLTTFEETPPLSVDPPMTPMRSRKKSIRRSHSDMGGDSQHKTAPTSSALLTPRSLGGKKKLPMQRSKSYDEREGSGTTSGGPPISMRKPSVRQAIPRKGRSSTTEYMQQLQQQQTHKALDDSSISNANGTTNNDELTTQSAHSLGASSAAISLGGGGLGTGAGAVGGGGGGGGRPSLAGMRSAMMMKSASQRFLGGLSGIASSTFAGGMSGITSSTFAGGMSPFLKPRGDAQLLNSDDEEGKGDDDNDEFATDKPTNSGGVMLRDFSTTNNNNNDAVVTSKSAPRSSRNLMANDDNNNDDNGGGVPKTPRRRRATMAAARQTSLSRDDEGVTRTPRRRRNPSDPRGTNRLAKRGSAPGPPLNDDNSNNNNNTGASGAYFDVDIDEDLDVDASESLGYGTTPRRARERAGRPMSRKPAPAAGSLALSEHGGAVTPRTLNARSRIRRASVTGFTAMPDLDAPDPSNKPLPPPPPATPGTLNARSRIRRASFKGIQLPAEFAPATAAPEPSNAPTEAEGINTNGLPAGSGHGRVRGGRPRGRGGRRGSIETNDPLLLRAVAQISAEDPTHAVRPDLQEEWKRQELVEDMRKKAKQLNTAKQYSLGGGRAGVNAATAEAPLFEAEFDTFASGAGKSVGADGDIDAASGNESGADLELDDDNQSDVSDLSSKSGNDLIH